MNAGSQESAISEVIAFILIFAMMMMALSLYVVYVVPAEGHENEIRHMNTIKNRFINYKISLDSLWNNEKMGIHLSINFGLGTGGVNTATGFFIPILKLASSGGNSLSAPGEGRLYPTSLEPTPLICDRLQEE
ncbi:MAG: hypothetical protein KAW93_01725 [Methanogenium sp.]|nr:hypothetical protein [Methanogenium sp.]